MAVVIYCAEAGCDHILAISPSDTLQFYGGHYLYDGDGNEVGRHGGSVRRIVDASEYRPNDFPSHQAFHEHVKVQFPKVTSG